MNTAIDIRGLRKSFGSQTVLGGIDLSVAAGSIFALLGPNGAGKTTLINILATLSLPDAGTASVAGHDVVRDARGVRGAISLTGQYAAVDEVLTGEEVLRMMARLNGYTPVAGRTRSSELLARFELTDAARKLVKTYSGGMRRRLDLAISLLANPAVIFLDEPTTGLDTRSRQSLWEIINGLAAGGTTVFLTTQYLEEADVLADRIGVINEGVIVAEGTAAELKARIGGDVVELRDASDELVREIPTDGTVHGLRAAIDQLDALAVPGTHVSIRKPSLDDVFLALTAHDSQLESNLEGARS
ncbi:ATP-binding cassette domain-containing protein [Glaciibacter superstes]|uniref:ATP-binding cassette domain-containing protein n=1 Tax=Glaciibacter superstes TaxID=501023 RepID=UPI0003B525A8|nr:ATP-binding cassette domain-containing protein [Glaciibacter superstes]